MCSTVPVETPRTTAQAQLPSPPRVSLSRAEVDSGPSSSPCEGKRDKAAFARDGRPCLILARVSSELRSPLRERARMTADLDRVKAASGRLQKVTDWQSEARHEFESAIHEAYKSGASTRQIAGVAGISHARVFQIISEP